MTVPEYTPPPPSVMRATQNSEPALRLLLAQRRLYRKAKRWVAIRWLGMLVVGLAAPVLAVVVPDVAVAVGAIAGLWLFLGRTVANYVIVRASEAAAAVQEEFDFAVFAMPASVRRSALPSPEEMASLVGPDDQFGASVAKERLRNWYPFTEDGSGLIAVAIAQRANAAYSDSLLRTTGKIWASVTAGWLVLLVLMSIFMQISLSTFLLGVLLPLLPAGLDVFEYLNHMRTTARDRGDLAGAIEGSLRSTESGLTATELMVWQEELYHMRRSAPEVLDLVYWLRRKTNEVAMTKAAQQLHDSTDPSSS